MKFNYYSLNENLLEKIDFNNETIYILDNFSDKNILEKEYKKDIFEKNPLFLTWSEFKERVFLTDKFLLKEEKRTLLLYKSLTTDLKEKLKINSYYDFIDYGENLLKFYKELKTYKIEDLGNLEPWQEKNYGIMKRVYENFTILLEENNYIVPEFLENLEFLDLKGLGEYKNIKFINIFDFTPIKKDLLTKLQNEFLLEFHLKMAKKSFDEKNLKFLGLDLDDSIICNTEIFEVKDKFESLINVVNDISEDNTYRIYSCDFKNLDYGKLVSENFIKKNGKIVFEESKLYRFLEQINEILVSKTVINGEVCYKIDSFILALENIEFCKYFGIRDFQTSFIVKNFVKEEYKYINTKILMENNKNDFDLGSFIKIFDFVKDLSEFKSLKNFTEFLSNTELFNYKAFNEERFSDIFAKYFEALTEIESNEMLNIQFNWSEFFNKNGLSEALFKLILKYLKHKSLEEVKLESYGVEISDFSEKLNLNIDKGIIIDICNDTYPEKAKGQFLLNNKQRKTLGLKTYEDEKELLRYNFFQRIATIGKSKIYSLKNIELNIDSSSFVDELILLKSLEIKTPKYSAKDLSNFVKTIFDKVEFIESNKIEGDFLPKDIKDLGENFYLGAYDYSDSKSCLYRFYLKHIGKIEKIDREINYDFENRTMGIIIHRLYEEIFREYHQEFLTGTFVIGKEKIKTVFEKILKREVYKIPQELNLYFKEIIMPIYIDTAYNFLLELQKTLENEEIKSFVEEKSAKRDILEEPISLGIKGRGDLIIETSGNNYIIDIKTGGSNSEQLPFYERLYFEDNESTKKFIYNAWEGKLLENTNILTTDELKMDLKDFLEKEKYTRAEKIATCRTCDYVEICRMRWENE